MGCKIIFSFLFLFSQGSTDHWCSDLLKASEEFLSSVALKQGAITDEELLMRHLFTVGEVAQVHVNWLLQSCANILCDLWTGEKA